MFVLIFESVRIRKVARKPYSLSYLPIGTDMIIKTE